MQKQKQSKPKPKAKPQSKPTKLQRVRAERTNVSTQVASNAAKRGLGQIDSLAASIAIPHGSNAVRFSDEYACEATAVASPYAIEKVTWSPSVDINTFFVFRNPLRAYVFPWHYTSEDFIEYSAYTTSQGPTSNVEGDPPSNSFNLAASSGTNELITELDPCFFATTGGVKPHGPYLYPGLDKGKKYMWVDNETYPGGSSQAVMRFTAHRVRTVSETCVLSLYRWEKAGDVLVSTVSAFAVSTNQDMIVSRSGYYRVAITSFMETPLRVEWRSRSNSDIWWCHRPLPDYENNKISVLGVRIISASLMWTNTAALASRGGTLAQWQAPVGYLWEEIADRGYDYVSSANQAVTRDAAKGGYSFLKPTQASDFRFIEGAYYEGDVFNDGTFPLVNESEFLVVATNIPTALDSLGNPRSAILTVAFGLEYRTDDVWRPVSKPGNELLFREALMLVKQIDQHYENPLHWKDIWSSIKSGASSVAKAVMKYGPLLVKMATVAAPFLV